MSNLKISKAHLSKLWTFTYANNTRAQPGPYLNQ